MDHVDFMPLGHDCSPASALRSLGFRNFALPFDWVVSNPRAVQQCLRDDFAQYHTDISLTHGGTQLTDAYGFRFPHDYPFIDMDGEQGEIGEGCYGVMHGRVIAPNWRTHYPMVKEKYNRRVVRFRELLSHSTDVPLIILCRYNAYDANMLYHMIHERCAQGRQVYMINWRVRAKFEELRKPPQNNDMIMHINPQQNGIWNDTLIWKHAIDGVLSQECNMGKKDP